LDKIESGIAMSEENRIDYLEIPARDLPKAKAFFTELFGWQFEDYGPEYCSFSDGNIGGGFFRSDLHSSTSGGACLIVIYNADLEKAVSKVTELGGTVTKEIYSFPGGQRFHFTDPNDNEYAIWSDK